MAPAQRGGSRPAPAADFRPSASRRTSSDVIPGYTPFKENRRGHPAARQGPFTRRAVKMSGSALGGGGRSPNPQASRDRADGPSPRGVGRAARTGASKGEAGRWARSRLTLSAGSSSLQTDPARRGRAGCEDGGRVPVLAGMPPERHRCRLAPLRRESRCRSGNSCLCALRNSSRQLCGARGASSRGFGTRLGISRGGRSGILQPEHEGSFLSFNAALL